MLNYLICTAQGEMVNCNDNENPNLQFVLGARLKHLYLLLDPLQIFSDSLLHDFLAMHRSVSWFPDLC